MFCCRASLASVRVIGNGSTCLTLSGLRLKTAAAAGSLAGATSYCQLCSGCRCLQLLTTMKQGVRPHICRSILSRVAPSTGASIVACQHVEHPLVVNVPHAQPSY